ncbi:MAG: SDR family NAD(P)-dependent oxidoreductase [Polyangiaceae bacterium]
MKTAVVTGANRGIGLEVSKQLVSKGIRVIVTAREEAAAREAARSVVAGPGSAEPFALDVTRPGTIAALADHVRGEGGLDILVNNAGVALNGFDERVARTTLDVNFHGPRLVTAALLPLMRSGGRIVMVSSGLADRGGMSRPVAARFTDPSLTEADLVAHVEKFVRDVAAGAHRKEGWPTSAYAVSKAGLNALTVLLARRLAADRRRILVNAVCPGWVRTRMGGDGAPVSVEDGARGVVWAALLPEGAPTGGFFRDEAPASW